MSGAVWGMLVAGFAALAAGLLMARGRVQTASGAGKLLVLAPAFEAAALAAFGAEHLFLARDIMNGVPSWLPGHLFWAYFVGVALLLAALSLIAFRYVGLSAPLLALMLLIFVATIHLPNLIAHPHERVFWTLVFRELSFAGGAMVLAGSVLPHALLMRVGRTIVALACIFYAIEHFLYPHNVPGVPLEKLTPSWFPAPVLLSYFVGIVLLFAGVGLLGQKTVRTAAAGAGFVLLLVTVFFYGPIMLMELHTNLAIEGINYVFDTMLFASTVLLAGWTAKEA
jgi:uncharacterized membrane protein